MLHGRREAERERTRSRQRHELSNILGSASLGTDVSDGLVAGLADSFPEALCIVALEDADHHGLTLSASAEGAFPSTAAAREIVVEQAATLAYDSGAAIVIGKEAGLRSTLPGVHKALLGAAHSFYATPLVNRGGSRLGALCLLFAHTHPLSESEQAQVAWYAEQAATALDRTTAFEREHEVAVRLQRSLLSERLPEVEGVELIGRYNAGVAGLEVGGDWYDAVRRSDGIVHVTVGDVAGHGVTAAVLMGQLRNAFRAHAYEHTSPAELLRRMLRHVDEDEMATALCLTLDPYTQELTYASAGHPPSLLVDGDAAVVSRLGQALAPPLGYVQASAIREATVELPAGATLVAYTDGLVERRGWSIDAGIDLLASVVGSSSSLGAEPLADRIFEEVAPHIGSHDDIALLIVRLLEVPQRMDIEVPSDAAGMITISPAPARLARVAGSWGRRARRHHPCRERGLQQRDRARLPARAGAVARARRARRGHARHSRRGPGRVASHVAELRARPRHPADARGHGHRRDRARRARHTRAAEPSAGLKNGEHVSKERQIGTVKVEFASKRTVVVALIGEHDLDSRSALRATLAYATECRNLLVDLTACTFIDSAVISLLLATQRRLEAAGRRAELIVPPQPGYVTRLFEVTGIASVFSVHSARSTALASIEEFALLGQKTA